MRPLAVVALDEGVEARILSLQADDRGFDRRRQPIHLPVRAVTAIAEGLYPAILVAVKDPGTASVVS
jgi:hypothetical protein